MKEGKQAEFLLYDSFPWRLVEKIAVIDNRMKESVETVLRAATYQPLVSVERTWYY